MPRITISTDDGNVTAVIKAEEIGDLSKPLAGAALLSTVAEAVDTAIIIEQLGDFTKITPDCNANAIGMLRRCTLLYETNGVSYYANDGKAWAIFRGKAYRNDDSEALAAVLKEWRNRAAAPPE